MLLAAALAAGCSKSDSAKSESGGGDWTVSADISLDGQPVTLAGVTYTPPTAWNDLGPTSMRKGNYAFGPVEGESDSATMLVFYFGQDGGGGVEDNIQRWLGQMSLPESGDILAAAKRQTLTVDGMTLHTVEVAGIYASGGMMGSPAVPKEHYVMTACVLEAPQGNLFFKLTGPEKTAAAMSRQFKAMVMAAKKAS